MNTQLTGYRTEKLELKNLLLFFLIAFGWSWAWWFLFIFDVLKMPAGVGTPAGGASVNLWPMSIEDSQVVLAQLQVGSGGNGVRWPSAAPRAGRSPGRASG